MSAAVSGNPPVPAGGSGGADKESEYAKFGFPQGVELKEIPSAKAIEEGIMQLARVGDVAALKRGVEAGVPLADFKDSEGITPLHWAAINNQMAACEYLLEIGSDVNAKGGESVATPIMWAAQRGHYYTVDLLLKHGADPLHVDVQGYNVLHLATFEGNVFLLILLLHQGIPVDLIDSEGHTCLMWSAYKGYPACVDLFLRWGANVYATDNSGFTALHWSLVAGNFGCVQKLLEYGSDRFAKTQAGKTPAVTAEEMKTTRVWYRALNESGFDEDGKQVVASLPFGIENKKKFMEKFLFLWPTVIIWMSISILSYMPIYIGVPAALLVAYGLQWVAQQMLRFAPNDMKSFPRTPWLAGIFAGTCFLVGLNWLFRILPKTFGSHPFLNLLFGTLYGVCAYFYYCTMVFDPGFVPRAGGLTQQKAIMDELLAEKQFDEFHFCVQCNTRAPLRSKHCRRCNRCVAKLDHHCPWVYNCVAVNNHRQFVLYILSMEIGIGVFITLVLKYLEIVRPAQAEECNILSPGLCRTLLADPYTCILGAWAALQLTWVTMLIYVQLVQIARNKTTYENMGGSRAQANLHGGAQAQQADSHGHHHGHSHGHGHGHSHDGWFAQFKKLLGLDTFVKQAQKDLDQRPRGNQNPFSRGIVTNCKDFFCDTHTPLFKKGEVGSASLDGQPVNYVRMYEPPARMRATASSSGATYERVAGEEV